MTNSDVAGYDIKEILRRLPHRYPFLLVDRVIEIEPMVRLLAYKNVTINEPFFQGHFPGLPVMPGVLIMEALAQAGALMLHASLDRDLSRAIFLFTGLDKVKFRKPVVPGDRLELEVTEVKGKFNIWKMMGKAKVDGKVAAEGRLTAAVVEKEDI